MSAVRRGKSDGPLVIMGALIRLVPDDLEALPPSLRFRRRPARSFYRQRRNKDFPVRYVPAVCTVIAILCALASLAAASHAAYLWYQSAKVRIEPSWKLEIRGHVDQNVITGTMTAFHQASRLNQRAVIWTGVVALLGAMSAVAGALPAIIALLL
jgi:hypothetical protein